MSKIPDTNSEDQYWTGRYQEQQTGWDIGYPSVPLKSYVDQLTEHDIKILIPGAGNAYEAEYLFNNGFKNVNVLDISSYPLRQFQERVPLFPKDQLIQGNFFHHVEQYDLILEQTFFCSFPPTKENREAYGKKMAKLLKKGGKLVGLWFNHPLDAESGKRPFGGSKTEYLSYLIPHFNVKSFELCNNSIGPRQGNELFGIFEKI